jgi:hypothetical protein
MIPIPFLSEIKAYGFMALAGVLTVGLGVQTWRLHGTQLDLATVRLEFSTAKTKAATELAAKEREARETETALRAETQTIKEQTNVQVQTAAAQRDALLRRLRLAQATRPVDVPGTSADPVNGQAAGPGAGGELPGQLGEADVLEAERADTIRLHLASCYRQYDRAQEALSKLAN